MQEQRYRISVPAGLFCQISKQVSLVLRLMFQVLVSSVMNFSYQLSVYTSDMKSVNFHVSLPRCIGHSVLMRPNKYPVWTVVASRVLISSACWIVSSDMKQVSLLLRPIFQVSVSSC
ncbi:uncharacterized protein [Dysidea avara]|uniref:uncharacterized protein n=1 Tax=Dysidea avara TaxID=196820 RepID=UPI00332D86ED